MVISEFLELTPTQLAAITKDYASSWNRWLSGERAMSGKSLINASKALNITPEILDELIKVRIAKKQITKNSEHKIND